jgi:hypothetical protein
MDDDGRIERYRLGSMAKNNAVTTAKEPAEIGVNQDSAAPRTAGLVKVDDLGGAAHPRSQGAGGAGIGEQFVNQNTVRKRERRSGEHTPGSRVSQPFTSSPARRDDEIPANDQAFTRSFLAAR